MPFGAFISFLAAAVAGALSAFMIIRAPRSRVHRLFAAGLLLLALVQLCDALTARSLHPLEVLFWQRVRFLPLAFAPGFWLLFSLSYARGNSEEFLARWRPVTRAVFLLLPAIVIIFWRYMFSSMVAPELDSPWLLVLGTPAKAIHVLNIVVCVAVLANLEGTLRASTGTMRWQIKFMILGLAVIFAAQVFLSSQALIYSSLDLSLATFDASAILVGSAFILWALVRSRDLNIDLYPSHDVLYRSLAAVLIGVYLLAVGVMANLVTRFGGASAFPLKSFFVLLALVGLTVLVLSNRMRQGVRRFVSRHLRRPQYDYRAVWSAFTEQTAAVMDAAEFGRVVTRMISGTFDVLSVNLWLVEPGGQRLTFGASTSLTEAQARELSASWKSAESVTAAIRKKAYPIDIDASRETWGGELRRCNPDAFEKGGNRICVPLVAGGDVLGLLTLGDRVNGVPFNTEEFDLLKTLGDQVAARLLNIRLSARLLEAREMEALQTMSTFFVHDLKNTVSTLSLMLQNLPKHFEDPAFRQDALDAIAKIVNKINAMIRRLTVLRQKLEIHATETDLGEVVQRAIESIDPERRARIIPRLQPLPRVLIDADQVQNVLINLLLNAFDADSGAGSVEIEIGRQAGCVMVSVKDAGRGMSAAFIEKSLFRPFKSTKKEGMGIGLFHSRMIVDAHKGRIEVESQEGVGTTFRILFPVPGG